MVILCTYEKIFLESTPVGSSKAWSTSMSSFSQKNKKLYRQFAQKSFKCSKIKPFLTDGVNG